ncbi:hypothetical protein SAMN06295888_1386 [Desulfonatronum zhilinae]|nr:hypothetical protein SAMN06295888_1386 [Desulfonatronum zhilinae]
MMTNQETNIKRKRGGQPGNKNAKKKPNHEKEAEAFYIKQMNDMLDRFNEQLVCINRILTSSC